MRRIRILTAVMAFSAALTASSTMPRCPWLAGLLGTSRTADLLARAGPLGSLDDGGAIRPPSHRPGVGPAPPFRVRGIPGGQHAGLGGWG